MGNTAFSAGGASGSQNPTVLEHRITQAGHTFSVGDPVYLDQGATRSFDDADVTVATDIINLQTHALVSGDRVQLTDGGAGLPTGLATGTDYYVRYVNEDNIQLSATTGSVIENTAAAAAFTDNAGTLNINMVGHGFAANDQIFFITDDTLPTGLTAGTPYFVNVVDVDNFEVSATSGPGASVTFTDAGTGNHTAYKPIGTPVDISAAAAATGHGIVPQDMGLYKLATGAIEAKAARYVVTAVDGDEFVIAQNGLVSLTGLGPFTAGADYFVDGISRTTGESLGTYSTSQTGAPFLEGRGGTEGYILSGAAAPERLQYIRAINQNGVTTFGSTNTLVPTGWVPVEQGGTQLTYITDAVLGDAVEVAEDGVYSVSVNLELTAAGQASIAVNTVQENLASSGASSTRGDQSLSGGSGSINFSWTGFIAAGDRVFVKSNTSYSSGANRNQMTITRVG
jgi:hypothetical protein